MGDVEFALAFAAKRAATRSMPASRWKHMLSLELAWMLPGEADGFVQRAADAGVLRPDGDGLRLAFDPHKVTFPRRFRPAPDAQPDARFAAGSASPPARGAAPEPTSRAPQNSPGPENAPAEQHPPAEPGPPPAAMPRAPAPAAPAAQPAADPFLDLVDRVANERGVDRGAVLADVASLQERLGGLATAEAAAVWLLHEADGDVTGAAEAALKRLRGG